MKIKTVLFVVTVFGSLMFSVRAEMSYQFTFTDKDGKGSLQNTGRAGGSAKVIDFAGKGIEFVKDAPVKGKNSCNFILQAKRQRSAKMELPNSEKILRCSKAGDKITVMTWVKWRGFNRESGVAATCPDGQKTGWGFRIMPDGSINFAAFGGFGHRTSKEKIEKNKWTHIALTWEVGNEKGLKFYINGKDAGINLSFIGKNPVPKNDNAIRVGAQTSGFHLPLNGEIYDLRIYDEILLPEQIARITNQIKIK